MLANSARQTIFATAAALVMAAWLGGCAVASRAVPGQATEVASGVFMVRGSDGEIDPSNLGRIGNAGFIVGPLGVIAIDTGVSYEQGRALLSEIARVTDRPVKLLLVTHARQEFLFGAAAFRERGIPIHMHAKSAQLMAARCEGCLKTLNRVLGTEAMRGTAMFKPDATFDATMSLDVIGRPVKALYFGHSSGPGDIAVFDETTGTLFAGGLLDAQRIPDVQDSELPGWHGALDALRALGIRHVVPGHGPRAGPEVIEQVGNYLSQLETRLIELLKADVALSEVPDSAALPGYERWDQYQTIHRRNASVLFVRMERDQLVK